VFIIILNIQVIRNGLQLVNIRYGNFDFYFPEFRDFDLSSAFFDVLNSISETCIGAFIKYIRFQNFAFHFYKDTSASNLLFVIITDSNFDPDEIRFQLKKIASVYNEKFSINLSQFNGNVYQFQNFREYLIAIT